MAPALPALAVPLLTASGGLASGLLHAANASQTQGPPLAPVRDQAPTGTKSAPASSAKPVGRSTPVEIPADVAAAVASGPTDVLVSFDLSSGLGKIRAATSKGFGNSERHKATADAAEAFAAVKRSAHGHFPAGLSVKHEFSHLPIQLVHVTRASALAGLAAAPGVTSIALPKHGALAATPPDLLQIHQPDAFSAGFTGSGVNVAVIDTGIDWQLPQVGDTFGDCTSGPGSPGCRIDSFATTVTEPLTCSDEFNNDPDLVNHHGTNVSGIIAKTAPAAHLDVYRVFRIVDCANQVIDNSDVDTLNAVDAVIVDAPLHNIRAVNLSLNTLHPGDAPRYYTSECTASPFSAAFLSLRALGVIPVVAAGNDAYDGAGRFHSGVAEPACASGAVRVGAVYSSTLPTDVFPGSEAFCDPGRAAVVDAIACFSQTGPLLSLMAPGVLSEGAGIALSGTSQASPHVAAAVADLASVYPRDTPAQLVRALTTTGPTIVDPRDGTQVHRLDIAMAAIAAQASPAEIDDAACTTTAIPANDDGSSPAVNLPFVANFFGTSYSQAFVNNNGNLTFQGPQSTYTPFTIGANTPPIIAPFFADVDTRATGSGLVTYGTTTYGSRPALCVNWNGVGYYAGHTNRLNSFQLLMVDRGDVGVGDFDMVMNFDALNWETGDASGGANGMGGTPAGAGYSAGDGNPDHFFEFPGSMTSNGLLDTNTDSPSTALVNGSRGSLQNGRYIFPVRNGAPPGAATLTGFVRDQNGASQSGSPVQACPVPSGSCVVGFTAADGHYTIVGLTPGSYALTALPPAGSSAMSGHSGPVIVGTGSTVTADLVLTGPQAPPVGTTITSRGSTAGGIPVLYWTDPISLDTTACTGATASYTITLSGSTVRSGALVETPAGSGHFHAAVNAFYPLTGDALVSITMTCPGQAPTQITFNIYIDPSGTVVNTLGAPVSGAAVTLLRSESAGGPFTAVPDGSAILSPSARSNPETTGADGAFHWDVLSGFYQVQAGKAGCTVPGSGSAAATSDVYEVPPPALAITLVLDCGESATSSGTTLTATPDTATVDQPVVLTATVSGSGDVPTGTVAFSASDNSITGCTEQPVTAGQATCSVTFPHTTTEPKTLTANYSGDTAHPASSGQLALTVNSATPVITWATPGSITYPEALSTSQLNATASVPGTFEYTLHTGGAAPGAVLHAGTGQLVDVTFSPTNTADYTTTAAQVAITVLPGAQALTIDPIGPVTTSTPTTTITAHGGGSGLPVTFASNTPAVCTVASSSGIGTTIAKVNVLTVGTCTLVASQAGNTDWAPAPGTTIGFQITAAVTAVAVDVSISGDKTTGGNLKSPVLSTRGPGEMLVAFISADGPATARSQQVRGVTGGGLTWTLAARANGNFGTAEIWQAYAVSQVSSARIEATLSHGEYHGSITVTAFKGAANHIVTSAVASANTGPATVRLTPVSSGSLIWAAGHNWNSQAAVTVPSNLKVVHQYVDRLVKDVYWTESTTDVTTAATPVQLSVLTPATGRWQFAAVEIPAAGGN